MPEAVTCLAPRRPTILTSRVFAAGEAGLVWVCTPMHLTQNITLRREMDEDPEYGFREETEADRLLMSFENLQLLAVELRERGNYPQAIERVCDYVVRDPVYADSTRSLFRSTLEGLRRQAS